MASDQRDLEELFAAYVDRLQRGEKLDAEKILAENPILGSELLDYLEEYIDPSSDGGGMEPLGTLGDYTLVLPFAKVCYADDPDSKRHGCQPHLFSETYSGPTP